MNRASYGSVTIRRRSQQPSKILVIKGFSQEDYAKNSLRGWLKEGLIAIVIQVPHQYLRLKERDAA
jgi:hypothetical protein